MPRLILFCLAVGVLLPVQMEAKVRYSHSAPKRRAPRAQTRVDKGRPMPVRTWKKTKPIKSKGRINQAYRIRKH